MGGLVKSLRVVLEDLPNKALKGVLDSFSTVLLGVVSVVPSAVSLKVLSAASLTMSSRSDFSWWCGGHECVGGGCF